jgi:hypothetical protein
VENFCKRGNETSGSIKSWELPSGCTTSGVSRRTELRAVLAICTHELGTLYNLKQNNQTI